MRGLEKKYALRGHIHRHCDLLPNSAKRAELVTKKHNKNGILKNKKKNTKNTKKTKPKKRKKKRNKKKKKSSTKKVLPLTKSTSQCGLFVKYR